MSGFFGNSATTTSSTSDGYDGLAQTLFTELINDGYNISNAPSFAPLLSQNLITSGGNIVINFSASFGANANLNTSIFRVLIDDIVERSVSTGFNDIQQTQSVSIVLCRNVSQGSHSINIEWAKDNKDDKAISMYILADTEPELYHASLLIQEVE